MNCIASNPHLLVNILVVVDDVVEESRPFWLAERGMAQLSILIVDDHAAVRSSIRSMMQSKSGWEICGEACNGLEAVEKTALLKPDLVLMDLSMPQLGGLEATRIIRRRIPTTKVLVISQNDPAMSSVQAIEAGAWGYLSKAALGTDLLPAVERFCQERRL